MEDLDKSAYARYISEQRETESAERRHKLVKTLLAKLPESERTVMTLYYLGEMTTKEIGRFLGVSVNTITSRLHRARKRLQQEEELLVQEMLGSVQLSANLPERIAQKVAEIKPAAPPTGKPVLPWVALGAAVVLIALLLGTSDRYFIRFQKPYSFEAASEPTIEIIEAPVVLETDAKPALRNQVGRASTTDKISGAGLQGSERVSTSAAPVPPEDTEPWMPDPALRAAVREELALPAVVPLTQEKMLQLHRLNAVGKGIADIKGLEFAQNLVDLHLGDEDNYIIDLSPLTTLNSLMYLNVGGNQVSDLRPLANLTNLWGLSLWYNQVTDISPLSSLTALTYLNLADNYVSDLSPLANLINLEKLDLFDNDVVNILPLTDLKNLKELILTDNHIKDFSPLAGLMDLQVLWIKRNPIKDLRPLSELNLTDLKYDAVDDPRAKTDPAKVWMPDAALRAVIRGELGLLPEVPFTKEKMLRLDYLYAHDKGIFDITGLEFATNLRELHLSKNPITDLRPLVNLMSLESLHIWKVSPSPPYLDIRPLANLSNLEMLSLGKSRVSDIRPLAELKKLRYLHLLHNDISDIRPLAGLKKLQKLSIEGNPITDFTPLAGLNLTNLKYDDNNISDIRPLAWLTELQTLWIKGNPITDFTPLAGLNLTDLKYDVIEQPTGQTDPADAWMPDAALLTAVRGETGLLPDVPLTKEKMLRLASLDVNDKSISDITGLEFATNLRELNMSNTPITDLRPIANLINLVELRMRRPGSVPPTTLDILPIANLINLEVLAIEGHGISDISMLANFTKLRRLYLENNHIEDFSPLAGLTRLRELQIRGNPIKDLMPLSGLNLTNLKYDEQPLNYDSQEIID